MMRLLAVSIFLCSLTTPLGAVVELYLKTRVQTAGGPLRVGDVARIENGGSEQAYWQTLILIKQSDLRLPLVLNHGRLRRLLNQATDRLFCLVGDRVEVQQRVFRFRGSRLRIIVEKWAAGFFPHAEVELSWPDGLQDIGLPNADCTLDLARGQKPTGPGLHTLNLVLKQGEKTVARRKLRVRIRLYKRVLVAKRALPRGRFPRRLDFQSKRSKLEAGNEQLVTRFRQIAGRRTTREIAAGSTVQSDWFEKPILVRRGDRILIVFEGEGVRISAPAEALEQGSAGDRILVRNLHSGRRVYALVRNNGELRSL